MLVGITDWRMSSVKEEFERYGDNEGARGQKGILHIYV